MNLPNHKIIHHCFNFAKKLNFLIVFIKINCLSIFFVSWQDELLMAGSRCDCKGLCSVYKYVGGGTQQPRLVPAINNLIT